MSELINYFQQKTNHKKTVLDSEDHKTYNILWLYINESFKYLGITSTPDGDQSHQFKPKIPAV